MSGINDKILGMEAEKGRWVLVILGMIINLCLGSVYAWCVEWIGLFRKRPRFRYNSYQRSIMGMET